MLLTGPAAVLCNAEDGVWIVEAAEVSSGRRYNMYRIDLYIHSIDNSKIKYRLKFK